MSVLCRDLTQNRFHIALFTEDEPPRLIVKWQIDHIRQYGSNDMAFKFQSGGSVPTHLPRHYSLSHRAVQMESVLTPCRKTSTGVDWFIVDTDNGAAIRIHKAVDYWAKYIVDQIRNPQTGRGVSAAR